MRTYSELITLPTFKERFDYLKLDGTVGKETFGFDRYLNQNFYSSYEWKKVRRDVIIRDQGCDLGVLGMDILDKAIVHHMNPICVDDILNVTDYLLNPEYLITTCYATHNALHYSEESLKYRDPAIRTPGDTCLW
jgi:hypothetical protein